MTVTFMRPAAIKTVSGSFASHVARHSANPGVDYALPRNTRVNAIASGVITANEKSSLVGWWTHIDFDNGWGADYLHADQPASFINIRVGQHVVAGQQMYLSGGSGSEATGPHLHISVRPSHGHALQNVGNVDLEKYIGAPVASMVTTKFIGGALGLANVKGLQVQLGVTADGVPGPQTIKAWQAKMGTPATGAWVSGTTTALQRFLGISADGIWGPVTTRNTISAIAALRFSSVDIPPATTPPIQESPVTEPTTPPPPPELPAPLPTGSDDANPSAPLAGLFAGHDTGRKRSYFAYAGAALVVSFGSDIITAGVLTSGQSSALSDWLTIASSILLKLGVAFGFVAASNVEK